MINFEKFASPPNEDISLPTKFRKLVLWAYANMPVGHDAEHAYNVWNNAKEITKRLDITLTRSEQLLFSKIIILHDALDHKFMGQEIGEDGKPLNLCRDKGELQNKYFKLLKIDLQNEIDYMKIECLKTIDIQKDTKLPNHFDLLLKALVKIIIPVEMISFDQVVQSYVDVIFYVHSNCSWSKRKDSKPLVSPLCRDIIRQILQDADWLEAIGEIGIKRCQWHQRWFHKTENVDSYVVEHIHEKLLHIPSGMNFDVTRKIIADRKLMAPIYQFVADNNKKLEKI